MKHSNKFILITCNNILHNFCTNSNTNSISSIQVVTGKANPTSSEIEQYLHECLDFLITNQLIVKTSTRFYNVTDKGKEFYRSGSFNV